jgi:hypothetical protein
MKMGVGKASEPACIPHIRSRSEAGSITPARLPGNQRMPVTVHFPRLGDLPQASTQHPPLRVRDWFQQGFSSSKRHCTQRSRDDVGNAGHPCKALPEGCPVPGLTTKHTVAIQLVAQVTGCASMDSQIRLKAGVLYRGLGTSQPPRLHSFSSHHHGRFDPRTAHRFKPHSNFNRQKSPGPRHHGAKRTSDG